MRYRIIQMDAAGLPPTYEIRCKEILPWWTRTTYHYPAFSDAHAAVMQLVQVRRRNRRKPGAVVYETEEI